MIPTWRSYPEGCPPGRALLWLAGNVIGMVCPGWTTYTITPNGSMERGPTVETEDEAREVVVARLVAMGALVEGQADGGCA